MMKRNYDPELFQRLVSPAVRSDADQFVDRVI